MKKQNKKEMLIKMKQGRDFTFKYVFFFSGFISCLSHMRKKDSHFKERLFRKLEKLTRLAYPI
jgi:hypothetical protein